MSAALIRLRQAATECQRWGTLAIGQMKARGPGELVCLADEDDAAVADAFADLLVDTVVALQAHFPHNLLGDLDFLAASILAAARRSDDPVAHLQLAARRIVGVHTRFGGEGPIRFRYVHDFIYGFDWARWVARDPEQRRHVGPFDLGFLERMQRRGDEMLELIQANDEKYPPLAGADHRNPFGFQRDPASEEKLLRRLAREGCLPVEAWNPAAKPVWDRDFAGLREATATQMNLGEPRTG